MTHFESLFLVLLFNPLFSRRAQVSRVGWDTGWDPAVWSGFVRRSCLPARSSVSTARGGPVAAAAAAPARPSCACPFWFVFISSPKKLSHREKVLTWMRRGARECYSGQCDAPVSSNDPSCGVTPCALVQLGVV